MDSVKILHTSDWHLGRAFHGVSMLEHQAIFIDHLLETVRSERVDLVVVAGDVYDRGLPPVDAVQVAHEALRRLASSRARVVITSGNHDSARRLGFAADLIDAAGVHLRTDASRVQDPVMIDDASGPVAVYGIPYLDPDITRRAWQLGARSHQAALTEAMRRIRADLATRPQDTRSVVLAHAFVAGGQPSDSERDIEVGGISRVPTSVFEGIDQVTLGHLHGAQELTPRIRYSGSPLAYSFSEAGHTKGSWLTELAPSVGQDNRAGATQAEATFVPAPVPRPLARINGDLTDLLGDPTLAEVEDHWLQVTLTDPVRPRFPLEQLTRRFAHVLSLQFAPSNLESRPGRRSTQGRTDLQITHDFVTQARGAEPTPDEAELLQAAVEACCGQPDADPALIEAAG